MPNRLIRAVFAMALILLASSSMLFAQSTSSSMSGRVMDESGGALPGVTITATEDSTGFTRSTVPATDGSYRFLGLPVGTYTVTTDLSGFNTVTTKNVVLNVATERTFNVTLRQASMKEQITVTADAPLIASEPSIGTVVSQEELQH